MLNTLSSEVVLSMYMFDNNCLLVESPACPLQTFIETTDLTSLKQRNSLHESDKMISFIKHGKIENHKFRIG